MKKVLKISTKICRVLLAVFGFSAVATSCVKYGMPTEYGMPHADFFLDGKIVSEETNEPIRNLKVRWNNKNYYYNENGLPIDSVFTNENGDFSFNRLSEFAMREYSIDIQDVDGGENGAFNDTTINVTINQNEFQGGKSWYEGEYHKSFDIKLKPKN